MASARRYVCYVHFFVLCLSVDFLPSSGCKTLQLFEDTHSVSCGLDYVSLSQHILGKRLKENTHYQHYYQHRKNKNKKHAELEVEQEVAHPSSPRQGLVVHQPGWAGRRIGPP